MRSPSHNKHQSSSGSCCRTGFRCFLYGQFACQLRSKVLLLLLLSVSLTSLISRDTINSRPVLVVHGHQMSKVVARAPPSWPQTNNNNRNSIKRTTVNVNGHSPSTSSTSAATAKEPESRSETQIEIAPSQASEQTSGVKTGPTTPSRNLNQPMTIETAIFLDHALSLRYASISQGLADLNRLVVTIMNQVKHMLQYSSLQKPIDIKLVLIESMKDSERWNKIGYTPDPERGDIDLYLTNFCKWQQTRLETNKEQLWWDHAILLSGLDLYKASPTGNQSGVLGLSWVGGMCKGNYSCTVGEAIHLESAFVIAHEIGHSLGMMHDGNRNNCDPNRYIMSDKTGAGKIHWSRCSNDYLTESLRKNQLQCLFKETSNQSSTNSMYDLSKLKKPGQVYNLNDQCRLAYGANYSRYMSPQPPYNNVCQELWCLSGSWSRPVHPALEGSNCGRDQPDSPYICLEGKCIMTPSQSQSASL